MEKELYLKHDFLLDFGKVYVNLSEKRTLTFSELSVHSTATIERILLFKHQTITQFSGLKKNEKNRFDFYYKPTNQCTKMVDFFQIIDDEIKKIVCVIGECIGPSVIISTKCLYFYRISDNKTIESTIELINETTNPTKFQFDLDNCSSPFKIEPISGIVKPKKHIFIKVCFREKNKGPYYTQVFCLIDKQSPIILEIYGLNAPLINSEYIDSKMKKYLPFKYTNSFEVYMEEIIKMRTGEKICIISELNLDFGRTSSPNFKNSLHTFIRNINHACVALKWEETDPNLPFEIPIKFWQLFPEDIAEVDCHFKPRGPERHFGHILYGRVFLYDNLEEGKLIRDDDLVHFPFPLQIRVIGNNFHSEFSWIPDVKVIPKINVLPLAAPCHAVYATFMLESKGQLPVVFKFKPPEKTNFSVKPMQGWMGKETQIITVKFRSDVEENDSFYEAWSVEWNGNSDNDLPIWFKAAIECPSVTVGEDNILEFGQIYPGCTKYLVTKLRNNTGHNYTFKFQSIPFISIEPISGILEPCEILDITFGLKSRYSMDHKYIIHLELSLMENLKLIIGYPYIFTVTIFGKCAYSRPCALPVHYNFGDIECENEDKTSFYLYNFGFSDIHFLLYYEDDPKHEQPINPFTVTPSVETVRPKERVKIELELRPLFRGLYEGTVKYKVRRHETSSEIVDNENYIWPDYGNVFYTSYVCFYPTVQFMDIYENTCGPLFGGMNVWEMFKIQKLNKTLRTISRNEYRQHFLQMPDAEHGLNIIKDMTFTLENITNVETMVKFVRKKNCDCEYKIVHTSMSRQKKVYDCPHRDLLDIKITDENFRPHSIEYLTFIVSYNLPGDTRICFKMLLSQNRTIEFICKVVGIEGDGSTLSPYTWNLKFKQKYIYIGVKNPAIQAYWFYNNTKATVNYRIDTTVMEELNSKYKTEIMKCINPDGVLEPKSICPIYFKYSPVDLRKIEIRLPFEYGQTIYTLAVEAQGVKHFYSPTADLAGNIFENTDYYHPGVVVSLSTEIFTVGPILTFTVVSKLFFLKNMDKEKIIAFCFGVEEKPDIIMLSVIPSKGMLRPREIVPCLLQIKTYGIPSATRTQLPLYFVDYTQLQEHIATKESFHKRGMEMQREFIYGAEGQQLAMEVNLPDYRIVEPPKIANRTLSITVVIGANVDRDLYLSAEEQCEITTYQEMIMYRDCLFKQLAPVIGYFPQPNNIRSEYPFVKSCHPTVKTRKRALKPKKEINEYCKTCIDRPGPLDMDENMFIIIHNIMEGLIGDTLNSKMFAHLVDDLNEMPPLYYVQFRDYDDIENRKDLVLNILNMPPQWLVSTLLEQFIQEAVLKMFNFTVAEFSAHQLQIMSVKAEAQAIGTKHLLKENYTERFMFLLDYLQ